MSIYHIYSDDELTKMVEKLNTINHPYSQWKWTSARKDHKDEFGKQVKGGEEYFTRETGPFDRLKLSRDSMDILIYVLFNDNSGLHNLTDGLLEKERERMHEVMNKLGEIIFPDDRTKSDKDV